MEEQQTQPENGSAEMSDAAQMILEKLTVLENKVESIESNGTTEQQELSRKVAADIPDIFEVKPRDGEPQTLSLHHPSFYKLEFVADEVEAMLSLVKGDEGLMEETGVGNFFLSILGRRELRDHIYKVLQIVLDSRPDPDINDLEIEVDIIKLLNPSEVIDALLKKCTPFFVQALQIFRLGRNTE